MRLISLLLCALALLLLPSLAAAQTGPPGTTTGTGPGCVIPAPSEPITTDVPVLWATWTGFVGCPASVGYRPRFDVTARVPAVLPNAVREPRRWPVPALRGMPGRLAR
jgi:hypothetical protein